jgi:hypothetical protein
LDLQALLTAAPGIGLDEVRSAELLSRLDSKFIVRESWLPELISSVLAEGDYRILEINGQRQSYYDNCFFDTSDRLSFQNHTRGRKNRHKARIRRYRSNGLSFLEVKHKTVHGRTEKTRLPRISEAAWDQPLSSEERLWLDNTCPEGEAYQPVMWSEFQRFTFVSPGRSERFTVDTSLRFKSAAGKEAIIPGCAIIEIKQERIDRRSALFNALDHFRGHHPPLGRSTSISKYVIGSALTQPHLPIRTYRPVMKQIERIFRP